MIDLNIFTINYTKQKFRCLQYYEIIKHAIYTVMVKCIMHKFCLVIFYTAMTHMHYAKKQCHNFHISIQNTTRKFLITSYRYIIHQIFDLCVFYVYCLFHSSNSSSKSIQQVYTCMNLYILALLYIKFV